MAYDDDPVELEEFEPQRKGPRSSEKRGSCAGWIVVLVGILAGVGLLSAAIILAIRSGLFEREAEEPFAPPPSGWREIASPIGRFRVMMPAPHSTQTRILQSLAGPVQETTYTCPHGDWVLSVGYADYDGPDQIAVGMEDIIRAARDVNVRMVIGGIVSEKDIQLGEHSGRELVMDHKTGAIAHLRWYAVKRRLYTLNFTCSRGQPPEEELARFFDSFQVTD